MTIDDRERLFVLAIAVGSWLARRLSGPAAAVADDPLVLHAYLGV